MRRLFLLVLCLWACGSALGQADTLATLQGRVTCSGRAVPYATLQLEGTSTGVSCNDAGQYILKLQSSQLPDTIVIRSVGYRETRLPAIRLLRQGEVHLHPQPVELREVDISSYGNGRRLVADAVARIRRNYQQQTAYSTFFYRDWRALNGELYLFDEAVMLVQRTPYSSYADKRGYVLDPSVREMEGNTKSLLRHRLLVHDRQLLAAQVRSPRGVAEQLEYADNESLFDPVATPQASYLLAKRVLQQHSFEPVQEFTSDGEDYWLVCSYGLNRNRKAQVRYQYTIRKRDTAIVRLASVQSPFTQRAPQSAWVNIWFNRMAIDADSSAWEYDLRDGHYTLTHYYNYKAYRLIPSSTHSDAQQQLWQQSTNWTLPDFSLDIPSGLQAADTLAVTPRSLANAFGASSFDPNFWGHYNTIPIDTLPLHLLKDKFHIP